MASQPRPHRELASLVNEEDFLRQRPLLLVGSLFLLLVLAAIVRVGSLDASRMLAEVQFRAALIARADYFKMVDSVPEWRKQVNAESLARLPVKEPPMQEFLVSLLYRLLGREDLRAARLIPTAFWLVGGLLLFAVARRVTSTDAAVFAVAYYLFLPLGVHTSISLLSDSFMIMCFLLSLLAILWYDDHPTTYRLMMAAAASGFAILVKPLCLPTILGAFVSLMMYNTGTRRRLVYHDLVAFVGVCSLPLVLYYLYGILVTGSLTGQAQRSFLPQLLLSQGYWKGWLLTATRVVGATSLAAAMIGVAMLRERKPRALFIGVWVGYAFLCLAFTYHIRFAGHYHLQLIVIVALSLGPLVTLISSRLRVSVDGWIWRLPVIGALMLLGVLGVRDIRRELAASKPIENRQVAQRIGEIVEHSDRVIYVATYYGRPLEYYAELSGAYWPRRISDIDRAVGYERPLSVEERLRRFDFHPEYFVITDFGEFSREHTDLRDYLTSHCHLVAESDQYLVYGTCTQQ